MLLAGRRALVTGAASGIGRSIADKFATAGARVWLADRQKEAAVEAVAQIGGAASAVVLDVTQASSVAECVAQVAQQAGGIDLLVNAAGVYALEPWLEITPECFDRVFAVNTRGLLFMTQAVAAHMVARGAGGAIVNIVSVGARLGDPACVAYSASKAAAMSLTQSAARALARHHIRVNAIAPGPVQTPMYQQTLQLRAAHVGKTQEEMNRGWIAAVPLGRIAAPTDIAGAAIFLASDAANYVTGQTLNVDGGLFMN